MNEHIATISKFFAGNDIFVTGGTGFMGKVLIEKLLYSCPDINRIFILLRPKKGKSTAERLEQLTKYPLFDRIRKDKPEVIEKLIPIDGDCLELKLGMSDESIALLKNVSIIFHVAANVRFDDPLRTAILMNLQSIYELCKIAEGLKQLKVLMHVSTTYCYPNRFDVDEKIYDVAGNWREVLNYAKCFDETALNILTDKITEHQPNTYTFTKGLAEQVVGEYSSKLPVIILRPSIVISSMREPFPGWIDNFNGPLSLLIGCGIGILRTSYGEPDIVCDYVPVDVAIKVMIVAAWKRGITEGNELQVVNCATSQYRRFTTGDVIEKGKLLSGEVPMGLILWKPDGGITRCKYYNYIKFMFTHVFIAILLDTVLRSLNKSPFLLKLQRKVYFANRALFYFVNNEWTFHSKNFYSLLQETYDRKDTEFQFDDILNEDIDEFFRYAAYGARKYLLNCKEEDLERDRKHFRRMVILDIIVKFISLSIVLIIFYKILRSFLISFL